MLSKPAYGVVHRARDTRTFKIVALKQLRIFPEERQNGIPITALREIAILRSLRHINIVNVLDVAVGEKSLDEVYMVMEYAEQVGNPITEGKFCTLNRILGAPRWLIFLCGGIAGFSSSRIWQTFSMMLGRSSLSVKVRALFRFRFKTNQVLTCYSKVLIPPITRRP